MNSNFVCATTATKVEILFIIFMRFRSCFRSHCRTFEKSKFQRWKFRFFFRYNIVIVIIRMLWKAKFANKIFKGSFTKYRGARIWCQNIRKIYDAKPFAILDWGKSFWTRNAPLRNARFSIADILPRII